MASVNTNKDLDLSEFPSVSKEQWEKVVQRDLKGADYKDKLNWKTGEGVSVLPFYLSEDIELRDPLTQKAGWEIRQRISSDSISDANRHALSALEGGANGLLFDLPVELISTVDDLRKLLDEIILDIAGIHFSASMAHDGIRTLFLEFLQDSGHDPADVNCSVSFDPFSTAILNGRLPESITIDESDSDLRDLAVNAQVFGNAGATITEQLAFSLAIANEYLGLQDDPEKTAGRIFFNFSTGSLYFPEIAKFRALRIMWAQVLDEYREGAGKRNPAYIHAENAVWNKFSVDAHNNLLRNTTEGMSAILGTCDALSIDRYDQKFGDESSFAERIARNTQIILMEESHLDKVADPGAGSYYIEELTRKFCEEAWSVFQDIEAEGGFHACLQSGKIQNMIKRSAAVKIDSFTSGASVRIGVNKYPPDEPEPKQPKNNEIPSAVSGAHKTIDTVNILNLENHLGEATE